ncbi:MAG: Rpn family recombination-promoting nuclease/putative transposase [Gammaproteobacteria bacterium]|nr:Rpn family recombination-promoting nuclease/putative transposase [Gammaproteobacteria bacterium]
MSKKISVHDSFIKNMMSNRKVACEFFASHLPEKIKTAVDLDNIKSEPGILIDESLRSKFTDLLYSAEFNHEIGYFVLLIEHLSTPDQLIPFRILEYTVGVMRDHIKRSKEKRLPLVYPMIIYSGNRPYNHSTDLFDLFGEHKALAREVLWQPYHLIDYHRISDEELRRFTWYGVVALLMKHVYDLNIEPSLREVFRSLSFEQQNDPYYVNTMFSYIIETREIDLDALRDIAKAELTNLDEVKIMTLADRLREEGRQQAVRETMTLADRLREEGRKEAVRETMTLADRLREEGRQEAIRDTMNLADRLREEGRQQAAQETIQIIARRLIKQGLTAEQIVIATGLSADEVSVLMRETA